MKKIIHTLLLITTSFFCCSLLLAQNVGIGTANPSSPLYVFGNADPLVTIDGPAGSQSVLQFSTAGSPKWSWYIPSGGADYSLYHYTVPQQNYFTLNGTNGNISLAPSSGNVGIGITSPLQRLSVDGGAVGLWNSNSVNFYSNSGTTLKGFAGSGRGGDITLISKSPGNWLRIGSNAANISFWTNGNADVDDSPQMVLTSGGDLNVAASLNIDQAGTNTGTLIPGITFGNLSGEGISSKRTATGNTFGLDFYTQNQNRVTIANNGNVGIGTNPPMYKLDVSGDANITGALRTNGNAGTSGQVLTSNGVGAATWSNTALSNNIRFSAPIPNISTASGNLPFTTRYNLSPANVTIGASAISIYHSGLYHFECHVVPYVYVVSPPSSPYFGLSISIGGSGVYELARNHSLIYQGGNQYIDNETYSIDLQVNFGQVITLPFTIYGAGAATAVEGWFTGYLISD